MSHLVLLTICIPFAEPTGNTVAIQPPSSAYVKRMMSLDRNKDGVLTRNELPGTLSKLMEEHDSNQDGKLTPSELEQVETKAEQSRQHAGPKPRGARGGGARRRVRNTQTGPGSPLDVNQILKFALQFDADGDGGLNKAELEKYAKALAQRRAQARSEREQGDSQPQQEKPKGLGAPNGSGGKNPFK